MVNANHDWLLFNPHNLKSNSSYYQQQILIARFYGFNLKSNSSYYQQQILIARFYGFLRNVET